ncbi:MAG TPA: flagellar hook-length control protein FliK [Bacillota bacterium]|nr:flagellar hook-length control protein FliK [Bacillota bacterium]
MNESLITPRTPAIGLAPQAAMTEGVTPASADSQGFQGLLQAVVEVDGEVMKATGVQQSLVSLQMASPVKSEASDEGERSISLLTGEKKSERENDNPLLMISAALASPPVIFQAVMAPTTEVTKEGLDQMELSGGQTSSLQTPELPIAMPVPNEMDRHAPSETVRVLQDVSSPVNPLNIKGDFAVVQTDDQAAFAQGQTMPVSPLQKEETPVQQSVWTAPTSTRNDHVEQSIPVGLKEDMLLASEANGEVTTSNNEKVTTSSQLLSFVAKDGETKENVSTPTLNRPIQKLHSVQDREISKAAVNSQEGMGEVQPMKVLVENVTVPVKQTSTRDGDQVTSTVIIDEEALSVGPQRTVGQLNFGTQMEEANLQANAVFQETISEPTETVDQPQLQQENSATGISFSTPSPKRPINITPVDLAEQTKVSANVSDTGLNPMILESSLMKKVSEKTVSSQKNDSVVEQTVSANPVSEERLQSKPIDPALMTARQHGQSSSQNMESGFSLKKPSVMMNDLKPVGVNLNEAAPLSNVEEVPMEKETLVGKVKKTAVLEPKTAPTKRESAAKETVPNVLTGTAVETKNALPADDQSTRTVKYEPREIVNQIVRGTHVMVRDGAAQMQLRLDPPELGRVELKIVAEQDGIKAHFVTESQTVKALIETELPHLRNALQQAGVQADAISVSVGGQWAHGGNNGHAFSGRENRSFYTPNNHYTGNGNTGEEMHFRESESGVSPWLGRINLKA